MMGKFSDGIRRFNRKAEARMETAVRKIAISVFSEVIMMTPVDTGRARGSWQVAIGNVPDGQVEVLDPSGTATISKATAEAMNIKAGDVIYMVSNLEYIGALEHGHSKQAPAGMVALTVQRWRPIVEQVAREIASMP